MTEYDYSPAAYERYLAQQARVSNWVADTVQQSHAYSNPFVLSPTLRDRTFYDESDDDGSVKPLPGRAQPTQFQTLDQWSNSSSRPSRSRSRSYSEHPRPQDYDRSARHRSHSQSRSAQIVYQPQGSQPYVYPQPHVVARTPAPPRTQTASGYHYPSNHTRSSSHQIYITQPPPGQIYHLSPGPGQTFNVSKDQLYRHNSQTRHHASKPPSSQPYLLVQGGGPKAEYKRGPPIHAPIPTKPHGQQPLLKRLLGFVTMSPVNGRSGNGRGPRGSTY